MITTSDATARCRSLLAGFRFHQVVDVTDVTAAGTEGTGRAAAHLFAAVVGMHADLSASASATERPAIAVAWQRPIGAAGVQVLVGGRPDFPPIGDAAPAGGAGGVVPLLYPPGSRARPVEAAAVAATWAALPAWVRCPARVDPLWEPTTAAGREAQPRRGGFDDYASHLAGGFAWLVVAEPLPPEHVDLEMQELGRLLPHLRQRDSSEPDRVARQRAEARYRELSRATAAGLWDVHILVGGEDSAGARRTAALLCSAAELDDLPYVLAPAATGGPLPDVWAERIGGEDRDRPTSPFVATAELVAAVARPPQREVPGIRLVEPPAFDLTPERTGPFEIGAVLDEADRPVGTCAVAGDILNRHTFVAGATGSGKSQTVRHLLERLHHEGVPWLVIEPAKAEYRRMAGRLGDGGPIVIRPGDPDAAPVGLNPLEPEPGFPLQTHIDLVRALFLAAFEAHEPFPQVLAHALTHAYVAQGWDPVSGTSRPDGDVRAPPLGRVTPRYPDLADLQRSALEVVAGIGYGREVADNVRGFVDVRIGSLRLGTPGRFFAARHPIAMDALLRHDVVVELEDIGNDQDQAFLMGVLLIRLVEHLRVRHRAGPAPGLAHVTVIEEAHRLLKRVEPGHPAAHAVELFTALLAETRAYGHGVVVVEQIPSKIVPDVVKNTALKIVHRLPAADDRALVGATMNLDDAQSRHVVQLPPGQAAVFTEGMDRALRVAVPLGEARESAPEADTDTDPARLVAGAAPAAHGLTARQLTAAEQLAADPELILWIELLTVAHLVGKPSPQPAPAWLDGWCRHRSPDLVAAAIELRVDRAIAARYVHLLPYFQPEDLGTHLVDCARHTLLGSTRPCVGDEVHWQAGRYRWVDVFRSLRAVPAESGPHPDTAAWAERGLHLPDATAADQVEALRRHPDTWRPAATAITGGEGPTLLDLAAAQLSDAPHAALRLVEASAFLDIDGHWPVNALGYRTPERT